MIIMVKRVVEVSSGGYKIGMILPKNQHTQRKLLNFENWCNGEASKMPKFDFQCQFSMKIIRNFLNFFFIEEFRSTFFDNVNF